MPELPEVETVCRILRPLVSGQIIASTSVFWPRTVEPASADEFVERVRGAKILSVARRAKLIVFHMSGEQVLTTHLRMTGKLLYVPSPLEDVGEPSTHLRALISFESDARLEFYDARKFGRIRLYSESEWEAYQAMFGPEPVDGSLDRATFTRMLKSRKRQIKPLLLDQQFIAGIGNIYADEALFKARIHPLKDASTISAVKAKLLHGAIVETLETAIANSGTTLRDYRSAPGALGTNQDVLNVYGAPRGTPCPRCGELLAKIVVGQRGTTFCPRCQRMR
jgi:formamidopyrimidine-DNA glycosylase